MIDLCQTRDPYLLELLQKHPRVRRAEASPDPGIVFSAGNWKRSVVAGDTTIEEHGLIELMDNNPLVCADHAAVPPPISTLAMVGLGPLAWAGLIMEPPTVISSAPCDDENPADWLATAGLEGGLSVHVEARDLGSVIAVTTIAAIQTPDDWDDIDALYDERFGRSFFVRRDESSRWDVALVAGRPHAAYRLRITPDEPHSLVTAFVLGDRSGKAGQAQLIHAMNVMSGFEESIPFS